MQQRADTCQLCSHDIIWHYHSPEHRGWADPQHIYPCEANDLGGPVNCGCPVLRIDGFSLVAQGHLHDPVDHPSHYTSHPSGVECIQITEHMNFCLGNAIKYIWRAGLKDASSPIEDLRKAIWYVEREIERLSKQQTS